MNTKTAMIAIASFSVSISVHATVDLNSLSITDKLLFQAQYMLHHSKGEKSGKPKNMTEICLNVFEEEKQKYLEISDSLNSPYVKVGALSASVPFTEYEINNMGTSSRHMKGDLRGTNKYITLSSLIGRPSFPHVNQYCIDSYTTTVNIVNYDGSSCREVLFESKNEPSNTYSQLYCANSYDALIKFD